MPKGVYQHKTRMSIETRKKMSDAHKGKNNHFYGKHHTEETKKKLSLAHSGKKLNYIVWNKGKENPFTKGDKNASKRPEIRKKISEVLMGRRPTEETKEKQRQSKLGSKSHFWKGGKSFEEYTFNWTQLLKKGIRNNDCFTCQLCEGDGNNVHHIDYDKKNCDLENLITLCRSCHTKTNFNRTYWTNFFQREMFYRKLPELYLLKII